MPDPIANSVAGKSDANTHAANTHTNTYTGVANSDRYGNNASSITYSHGDGDNHAKAYADTKAAAHAVSSADAVTALKE